MQAPIPPASKRESWIVDRLLRKNSAGWREIPSAETVEQAYWGRREIYDQPWLDIAISTGVAAATLPSFVFLFRLLAVNGVDFVLGRISYTELSNEVSSSIALGITAVVSSPVAFAVGISLGSIVIAALSVALTLLRVRLRVAEAACFVGGLAAYLTCLPLTFDHVDSWSVQVPILAARLAATVFSAAGVGYLAAAYESVPRMARLETINLSGDSAAFRFRTRHLLGLATIACLGLAILKVLGVLTPRVGLELALWIVMQGATFWPTVWLVDVKHKTLIASLREYGGKQPTADRST